MIDPYPCTGLGELFFASTRELKYPEDSSDHASAKELCRTCPNRRPCIQQGMTTGDRHTVRGGYRFWLRDDRRAAYQELSNQPDTDRNESHS